MNRHPLQMSLSQNPKTRSPGQSFQPMLLSCELTVRHGVASYSTDPDNAPEWLSVRQLMGIAVGTFFLRAAIRDRLCSLDHERSAYIAYRTVTCWLKWGTLTACHPQKRVISVSSVFEPRFHFGIHHGRRSSSGQHLAGNLARCPVQVGFALIC